jgi:hypothetical protein
VRGLCKASLNSTPEETGEGEDPYRIDQATAEVDGQQKDISVKEGPKGPPDPSRVAQPTAARGGIL